MSGKKVIVLGAGAWGGWSAYMLQKAGCEVTLVDKNGPGNPLSGSGGNTRIIRMAYAGNPTYIDMVARAFELWEYHCDLWQEKLLHNQEAFWLFRGVPTDFATSSQPLIKERGYALEEASLKDMAIQYRQMNLKDITHAYHEPKVGYLEAARACKIVVEQFIKAGGTYQEEEVVAMEGINDVEYLRTRTGKRLQADEYVLAAGPWMKQLIPELKTLIKITRHEVYYFDAPSDYGKENLPIWLEFREGDHMFYGIPDHFNEGFKLAYDQRDFLLDPDNDNRGINPEILEVMRKVVENRFPALKAAPVLKHHTCVYESTPDGDYIMDKVPGYKNAIVLCGSSGHGFKMGPAIGEMMKDHLLKEKPFPADLAFSRFENRKVIKTPYQVVSKD